MQPKRLGLACKYDIAIERKVVLEIDKVEGGVEGEEEFDTEGVLVERVDEF